MAPRKQLSNGVIEVPASVSISSPPALLASKIPNSLRFPLVVLLNLLLSAVLFSISSQYTAGDLSSVSRSVNQWWEVGGLLGCKALELAVGWFGEYDSYDLASLTLLSHTPPLYLLMTFYGIRPTTTLSSLAIDMVTTYIPFRLLRPVSPTHTSDAPKGAISNRSIISDWPVQIYTTLLAAGIYGVVVFSSYLTWLPVHLVTYFEGLRDISAAHSSNLPILIFSMIPVGVAAKTFLFTPATGARPNLGDVVSKAFNPETATLGETIRYNIWGYSKRTRIMIKRTATLAAVCFGNTWLQVHMTIEGTEGYGAAGWAALWAAASLVTGAVFWWVGDVEGMTN